MLIIFNKLEEAVYFCKQVHSQKNCYQYVKQQQKRHKFLMQFSEDTSDRDIVSALQTVFNQFRLHQSIHLLTQEVYFYEEYDEMKMIVNYTIKLLSDEQSLRSVFSNHENFNEVVYHLYKREVCSQEDLSFDTITHMVVEQVQPILIEIIGFAIEEWKSDVNYDYFISSLQHFISWHPPKIKVLNIIQDHHFLYFTENGEKYAEDKLREIMNHSLIYSVGLSENEWNLSPIIALAPKLICIYGNDETDAQIVTIKKLFKSRVQFFPEELFPFYKVR